MQEITFQSVFDDNLSFSDIISSIKSFIDQDPDSYYMLTIGSDSEIKTDKKKDAVLEVITAVVIYRKGYGGKYFWYRKRAKSVKSLRDKIYTEVMQSIEIAKELIPDLKSTLNGHAERYELEIHIDVGEVGATREMIKEVVGMVTGIGFTAKTKPYSYAASNIADRYT